MSRRDTSKVFQLFRDGNISKDKLNIQIKYFISLPPFDDHNGHIRDIRNINLGKTNPKIFKIVQDLTESGITQVSIQRNIIHQIAKEEQIDCSEEYNFPSGKTILNKIRRTMYPSKEIFCDQDRLEEVLINYLEKYENISIYFNKKNKCVDDIGMSHINDSSYNENNLHYNG